jgi:hypothetical protein
MKLFHAGIFLESCLAGFARRNLELRILKHLTFIEFNSCICGSSDGYFLIALYRFEARERELRKRLRKGNERKLDQPHQPKTSPPIHEFTVM